MVMKSTMPANKIIRGHGRGSQQSSAVQQRRKNGTAAPLSSLPEVKNGCSRDGYGQGRKSIFEAVAVRSPNVWRFQANQSAIGMTADPISAATDARCGRTALVWLRFRI